LESIRKTGGLVPDTTWEQNKSAAEENAALAENIGIELVTFHVGFIPHKRNDPQRKVLLERLRVVADIFACHGIKIGMETGQETADTLLTVLDDLDRDNVGVNFDPANMILYGMGDPIASLKMLGDYLVQVHIKDAIPAEQKDKWGSEVVVGKGSVPWKDFFRMLNEINFSGFLMIEREAGDQRVTDIQHAITYLKDLIS